MTEVVGVSITVTALPRFNPPAKNAMKPQGDICGGGSGGGLGMGWGLIEKGAEVGVGLGKFGGGVWVGMVVG